MSEKKNRWLALVYNHNPFYLISAAVILYALRGSQVEGEFNPVNHPWLLSGVLIGYTLLLAATTCWIVRLGKVWDDARSILMVILLMLFAVSVSFDRLCLDNPSLALFILGLGSLFSVVLIEGLLRVLRIELKWKFRLPLHAMLLLSFYFPLIFSASQVFHLGWDHRFILFGFSFAAAITILFLLPAVRASASYVENNGSPWVWPLFPYSVFFLLVIGLCGRTYLLTEAFDTTMGRHTILGWYQFAPILLSCLIVVHELCLRERLGTLRHWIECGMLIPAGLCLFSRPGLPHASFFYELGTYWLHPSWTILVLTTLFFLVTFLRTHSGEFLLTTCLVGCCFLGSDGHLLPLDSIQAIPLILLAGLQLIPFERWQNSVRWWTSFIVLMPLTVFSFSNGLEQVVVGLNYAFFAAAMIGLLFDDSFSRKTRSVLSVASPVWFFAHWLGAYCMNQPSQLIALFGLALSAFGLGFTVIDRRKLMWVSLSVTAILTLLLAPLTNASINGMIQAQFGRLVMVSLICFGLGVLVSLSKAGVFDKWIPSLASIHAEFWSPFDWQTVLETSAQKPGSNPPESSQIQS